MMTEGSPAAERPPPGVDDGEAVLWRAFKIDGSLAAREQLFASYFPYARQIARRRFLDRRAPDIEFGDLVQLASAGLLQALDHYEPERGVPFRAYASRRVTGSILDGVAKMSEVREQISFRNRMRAERTRSLAAAKPDSLDAASAMQALAELAVGLALGFMLEDAGFATGEQEAQARPTAYDSMAWKETVRRLADEVAALPEREQLIIRRHYVTGLTFDQIGALLGVTKGRVSQIHRVAIGQLRKRLNGAGEFKLER